MRNSTVSNLFRLAVVPAAIAFGVCLPAQAEGNRNDTSQAMNATAGTKAATDKFRDLRGSKVIGMSVRNPKGEDLGEISNMIVNMNTGAVRYAILEFDPGIFQAEELYAVPITELRMAADRDDVVYDLNRAALERARVDRDTWGDGVWNDPDYLGKLDKVYGIKQPASGARAHRLSDLIGMDVNDKSGEKIGELEDVIVNMATQKVHYTILEFDPSWASPEQNYAFPLTAYNLTDDKDALVLDITKDKLAAMKSFPDSRYDNLNDRVWVADIDRYFITVLPARNGAKSPGNAAMNNSSPTALFDRLDEDNNGSLNKAEVKDSADVDRNWTRFDKNGDGQIDRDEFTSNYTIDPKRGGKQATNQVAK